jgi:hypothetical protein
MQTINQPNIVARWSQSKVLILAMAILWITTGLVFVQCFRINQGHLSYTLDDAFIHLASAKNFARYGVFGVTPFEFSSSESSLLWCFLLAAIARIITDTTVLTYAPLVLNLAAATGILVIAHRAYSDGTLIQSGIRKRLTQLGGFLLLLAIIFVSPLPWLMFTGMEHTLQTALVLGFVCLAAKRLSEESLVGWSRTDSALVLLAPLVTSIRYEDLFAFVIICLLFLMRRRLVTAIALGVAGILPLVIYGVISVRMGSFWLPNSIVMKGRFGNPAMQALADSLPHPLVLFQLSQRPYMILFLGMSLIFAIIHFSVNRSDPQKRFWHPTVLLPLVFLGTTIMNLQSAILSHTLSYFRYDAYLVVLGLLATAVSACDRFVTAILAFIHLLETKKSLHLFRPLLLSGAILIALAPIMMIDTRAAYSINTISQASHNIYTQQMQMAQFVSRYYAGEAVVLNDIGAVNYASDIHCIDLCGLATIEMAKAQLNRSFNREKIRSFTKSHNGKVAIVYTSWFENVGLPKEWELVGEWKIPDNVICGGDVVSFYALNPDEHTRLSRNLHEFAPSLPSEVSQTFAP